MDHRDPANPTIQNTLRNLQDTSDVLIIKLSQKNLPFPDPKLSATSTCTAKGAWDSLLGHPQTALSAGIRTSQGKNPQYIGYFPSYMCRWGVGAISSVKIEFSVRNVVYASNFKMFNDAFRAVVCTLWVVHTCSHTLLVWQRKASIIAEPASMNCLLKGTERPQEH